MDRIEIIDGITFVVQDTTKTSTVQIEPAIRQIVNAIGEAHNTIAGLKNQLDNLANQLTDEQINQLNTEITFFASRYNDRFAAFVQPLPE